MEFKSLYFYRKNIVIGGEVFRLVYYSLFIYVVESIRIIKIIVVENYLVGNIWYFNYIEG